MTKHNSNQDIESIYPPSPLQQGMLFESLLVPDSEAYLGQLICTLTGDLQETVFHQAWQLMVKRHAALRTMFVWKDREKPLQVVFRSVDLPWTCHDWRRFSSDDQQLKLAELLGQDRRRGFDLSKPPLMRLTLIQTSERTHDLVWTLHHLLLDGWSVSLVLAEVMKAYAAMVEGSGLVLEQPRPYREYISWLQKQDSSKVEAHWRMVLEGFSTPTPFNIEKPKREPSLSAPEIQNRELIFSSDTFDRLKQFCKNHKLTLNSVMQGAWALLLSRYSGENDVVFGSVVAGRPADLPDVASMVGMFINTLPVRARFDPEAIVSSWFVDFQTQLAEMRQYEHSPLVNVHGFSQVPRNLPLFESFVDFVKYPVDSTIAQQGPLQVTNRRIIEKTNYPVGLLIAPGESLTVRIPFDTRRFHEETIGRMLGHYQNLLEGIISNPDEKISRLPLLTEGERQKILVEWNRTAADYPRDRCLHELIEQQVERTPEAVAVVFEDKALTYRELNGRANQLAWHLRGLGVGADSLVGICVERSLEMVVGLLAILKAGGAYVPLDPEYPKERLAFMLEDSGVGVLLTQADLEATLPPCNAKRIRLDADWTEITRQSPSNPPRIATPRHLAYVIYTSGSTGKPKGVQIPHSAVVNFLHSMRRKPGLTPQDTLLAVTTLSFDIAGLELWLPMMAGARVVIAKRQAALDAQALIELLERNKVSVMQATPGTWQLLLAGGWNGGPHLKILCGGESWSPELARQLLERCQSLWNMYGPTETTIWSAACQVETGKDILIGEPIANTRFFVVDRNLQPVPIGVPGELCIGGEGLARGYLNRPELSAEKFPVVGLGEGPERRIYRTGDLVRLRLDGSIEFLGRLDHQVKIRGHRIELGEIEALLARHPALKEAVVTAHQDRSNDKRLVAYIVHRNGTISSSALREYLGAKLPDYMLPSAFVALNTLPLTPNGKVNRNALPNPDFKSSTDKFVPPDTLTEIILERIWCEVLGLKQMGMDDNFFESGGHSLLAVQLISKINKALKVNLPVPVFFKNPTIHGLAAVLDRENHDKREPKLIQLQPGRSKGTLFLLDASIGLCRLAQHLGDTGLAVYGTVVPFRRETFLAASRDWTEKLPTIQELAAEHIKLIQSYQHPGPCFLVGHSFGGLLAFEISHQLRRLGRHVEIVFLLDAWARHPLWWKRLKMLTLARARKSLTFRSRYLWLRTQAKLMRVLRQFGSASKPADAPAPDLNDVNHPIGDAPWEIWQKIYRKARKGYHFVPLESRAVLFRARHNATAMDYYAVSANLEWDGLFKQGLRTVEITGDHLSLLKEPNVSALAGHITDCLQKFSHEAPLLPAEIGSQKVACP